MRSSKFLGLVLFAGVLGACASWGNEDPNYRMFGKYAQIREVAGEVITTGTSWWGGRYIVVKDQSTGLRIYVQSDAAACVPGKPFKGTGHLTRAEEKDYDATFHFHLTDVDKACS